MSGPTTPETPAERREARLRWARDLLRVPGDADDARVAGLLLERVEEADFVPPEHWHQALDALAGGPTACAPAAEDGFLQNAEEELGQKIERLAAQFFKLPIAKRRAIYVRLRTACEFSVPLTVRLRALEPGLSVDPTVADDEPPAVRELARRLAQLLVLRPLARATAQRELWRRAKANIAAWQRAARRLRSHYPGLAEFAPGLVNRLAGWKPQAQPREIDPTELTVQRRLANAAPQESGSGCAMPSSFTFWVILLVAMAGVRACRLASNTHTPPPSIPPVPSKTFKLPPGFPTAPDGPEDPDTSTEAILRAAERLAAERRQRRQAGDAAPGRSSEFDAFGEDLRKTLPEEEVESLIETRAKAREKLLKLYPEAEVDRFLDRTTEDAGKPDASSGRTPSPSGPKGRAGQNASPRGSP